MRYLFLIMITVCTAHPIAAQTTSTNIAVKQQLGETFGQHGEKGFYHHIYYIDTVNHSLVSVMDIHNEPFVKAFIYFFERGMLTKVVEAPQNDTSANLKEYLFTSEENDLPHQTLVEKSLIDFKYQHILTSKHYLYEFSKLYRRI